MSKKLSTVQFWLLVSTAINATVLIFIPTYTVKVAGKDAWLVILINMFVAIPAVLTIILPGLRFPGQNFAQYSEAILGKILGKVISTMMALVLLFQMAVTLRQFTDMLIVAILPHTPISILIGMILLVSTYAVYIGIQVIGRFTQIMAPIGYFFIVMVLIMLQPQADYSNIHPIIEYGWMPVFSGIYGQLAFMPQVIIMAFLLDKIENPIGAIKAAFGYVLLVGVALVLINLVLIAVYTEEYAKLLFLPLLSMSRTIIVPGSLFSVDLILITLWIMGIFLQVSVLHYIVASTLGNIIRARHHRSLIMPIGLIAASWSLMMFKNHVDLEHFILTTLPTCYLTLFIGVPAFMLLVAVLRKKGEPTIVTLKEACWQIRSDMASVLAKLKQVYDSIYMPVDSNQ
ncbi:MAG: GerAB/ArcD/ProY family transporter [Ignavibacteriales bacterium]